MEQRNLLHWSNESPSKQLFKQREPQLRLGGIIEVIPLCLAPDDYYSYEYFAKEVLDSFFILLASAPTHEQEALLEHGVRDAIYIMADSYSCSPTIIQTINKLLQLPHSQLIHLEALTLNNLIDIFTVSLLALRPDQRNYYWNQVISPYLTDLDPEKKIKKLSNYQYLKTLATGIV